MKILSGLKYSKDHEWVKVEGDRAYIGITDYAQDQLGDIVFVELPQVDSEFAKGDVICTIESVKAAAEVYSILTGTIVEVNSGLELEPEKINQNPYEGFIVAMEIDDPSELEELMDDDEYKSFIEGK